MVKRAPGMENARTDEAAVDLLLRTPVWMVPELADLDRYYWMPWHTADPRVRDVFRDRARRLFDGDMSVLRSRCRCTRRATRARSRTGQAPSASQPSPLPHHVPRTAR